MHIPVAKQRLGQRGRSKLLAKHASRALKHVVVHARWQVHNGQVREERKAVDRGERQVCPVRCHAAAREHPCAVYRAAADQRLEYSETGRCEKLTVFIGKNKEGQYLRIWSMPEPSSVPSGLVSRKKFCTSSTRIKCGTLCGKESTNDLRQVTTLANCRTR